MKSIFEASNVDSVLDRIQNLEVNSNKEWGKMNATQMVKHCILSEKMYQGKDQYKRLFIGRLFGKMALKSMVKDNKPLKKNEPTHPTFKIKDTNGNFESLKGEWSSLVEAYDSNSVDYSNFQHPFFGKMERDQIGVAVYKHIDHHLRQFGV